MSETRPTPLESLSKAYARLRNRGPAELASTLRSQVSSAVSSQGSIKLLVRDAGGEPTERPPLEFRRADRSDAAAYERDIGTDSAWSFRRRLTEGTDCYLVLEDERILHASWTTTRRAWTSELRAYLSPPPGDAYIYESYTRPETRGRGIYPFALGNICAELGGRGIRSVWVGVEPDNVPSTRAITKAGFAEALELPFERKMLRVRLRRARGPMAHLGQELVSEHPPR